MDKGPFPLITPRIVPSSAKACPSMVESAAWRSYNNNGNEPIAIPAAVCSAQFVSSVRGLANDLF